MKKNDLIIDGIINSMNEDEAKEFILKLTKYKIVISEIKSYGIMNDFHEVIE